MAKNEIWTGCGFRPVYLPLCLYSFVHFSLLFKFGIRIFESPWILSCFPRLNESHWINLEWELLTLECLCLSLLLSRSPFPLSAPVPRRRSSQLPCAAVQQSHEPPLAGRPPEPPLTGQPPPSLLTPPLSSGSVGPLPPWEESSLLRARASCPSPSHRSPSIRPPRIVRPVTCGAAVPSPTAASPLLPPRPLLLLSLFSSPAPPRQPSPCIARPVATIAAGRRFSHRLATTT